MLLEQHYSYIKRRHKTKNNVNDLRNPNIIKPNSKTHPYMCSSHSVTFQFFLIPFTTALCGYLNRFHPLKRNIKTSICISNSHTRMLMCREHVLRFTKIRDRLKEAVSDKRRNLN